MPTVEPNLPAAWQGHEQSGQRDQPQHPQSRTAAPKWRGWLITLGAIGAAVWFFSWLGNNSSTNSYSNPSSAGYSPPAQSQALSRPTGSKPPVGQNLVLSSEQIRYRSEEHTSELQSLMRISYDFCCLTHKKTT